MATEWNGEGIPPVGTECEAIWGTKLDGWHRAVIVETFKGGAVFAFKWADGWDFVDYDEASTAEFRPLQSEEQKQVAEIEQLLYAMSTLDSNIANIYAKAIYNAGFRKAVV